MGLELVDDTVRVPTFYEMIEEVAKREYERQNPVKYECDKCHAGKGEHALGEACNGNCGGTVVKINLSWNEMHEKYGEDGSYMSVRAEYCFPARDMVADALSLLGKSAGDDIFKEMFETLAEKTAGVSDLELVMGEPIS